MTQDTDTVNVRLHVHVVTGPGGKQILREDPSGHPVELFRQPGDNGSIDDRC
jgi:hypothetical protein